MNINFGKYAGYTAKEVAIVDSGYAAWAANNLKNAAMRQAFAQAPIDAKSATVEEIASAHEDPSSEHYGKVLAMVADDKAKEQRIKAQKAEIINRYAKLMNVPAKTLVEKAKGMFMRDIEEIKMMNFSSVTVKNNFVAMMEELFNTEEI